MATENQGEQGATNPFDISAEESELKALQAEIEQARASLETDFAKFEAEKFASDQAFQELIFENAEAFFAQILQDQNAYLAQNFTPKVERAEQLNADIAQKQQFGAIDAAAKAFMQNHPEADINELMRFFSEELPPKVQNELQSLPPEQFFEELFALYEQVKNGAGANAQQAEPEPAQQENLPQQIQGVPTQSSQAQSGGYSENAFDRL